jgi:hypothetical protein
VAVFLARVVDVRADGLEDPQSEQPEQAHKREVERIARLPGGGEQGLELQVRQSQCRRLRRHGGRRTLSAGECSKTPSMTQVREKPATTENRRDTVDGLKRRTSCIQRR